MSCRLALLILGLAAVGAQAQGISGVTRRTTTLERQAAARQFFDAAGINVSGAGLAVQPLNPRPSPIALRPTARPAIAVATPTKAVPTKAVPLILKTPALATAPLPASRPQPATKHATR